MTEIYTVCLPDIGEGVVEGEVIQWLKNVGDPIAQDEPVVIVMTDKATVELPAPKAGKLLRQHYRQGEIAIKDKPLYDISLEASLPHAESLPGTRHLAKEMGIDIETIQGTGKEGRVTTADLKLKKEESAKPLGGIPGLMAKHLVKSLEIPHFSYFEECEATHLVKLREKYKEKGKEEKIPVTYMPFFIRALSLCLTKYPNLNSSFQEMSIIHHEEQNIGIAISRKEGLIVPILKEVEKMSLPDIVRAYHALLKKKLFPEDMKGATVTISNFGALGDGSFATPLIIPPQVAILGVNRIRERPFVRNGSLEIRPQLNLSWSFDHRVIDGSQAAGISHFFATLIQNPASLI